jgi:translation initiation factor 4B
MVKNWADHCSSDEEEEDVGRHSEEMEEPDVPPPEPQPIETHETEGKGFEHQPPRDHHHQQQQEEPSKPRVYDLPSQPPFTAYVGNLAYSIQEADDLAIAVADVVKEYLNADIRIVHARVMKDKMNHYKSRGFGYVEVETLDMLQTILQLNEVPDAMLAGRKIQVDTATGSGSNNQRRGGSFRNSNNNNTYNSNRRDSASNNRGIPDIDGSKFRGGRYSHKNQRNSSTEAGGGNNNDKEDAAAATAEPPTQRTSLKLKPRSKPLVLETGTEESKNESIFGGAKARDEQAWRERRHSEKEENRRNNNNNNNISNNNNTNDRRGSRSSGRGSGHTQPHHDSGRKNNHSMNQSHKSDHKKKEESSAHTTKSTQPPSQPLAHKKEVQPANAKTDPEKAAPKKVTNTFAALAMDSDSD